MIQEKAATNESANRFPLTFSGVKALAPIIPIFHSTATVSNPEMIIATAKASMLSPVSRIVIPPSPCIPAKISSGTKAFR